MKRFFSLLLLLQVHNPRRWRILRSRTRLNARISTVTSASMRRTWLFVECDYEMRCIQSNKRRVATIVPHRQPNSPKHAYVLVQETEKIHWKSCLSIWWQTTKRRSTEISVIKKKSEKSEAKLKGLFNLNLLWKAAENISQRRTINKSSSSSSVRRTTEKKDGKKRMRKRESKLAWKERWWMCCAARAGRPYAQWLSVTEWLWKGQKRQSNSVVNALHTPVRLCNCSCECLDVPHIDVLRRILTKILIYSGNRFENVRAHFSPLKIHYR